VIVFDPLALTLLLAATKSIEWERGINIMAPAARRPEDAEDEPEEDARGFFDRARNVAQALDRGTYQAPVEPNPYQNVRSDANHWYDHIDDPEPVKKKTVLEGLDSIWLRAKNLVIKDSEAEHAPIQNANPGETAPADLIISAEEMREREAERAWKAENPDKTLKRQRQLYRLGLLDQLPWMNSEFQNRVLAATQLQADNEPLGTAGQVRGFGLAFPGNPAKGDMFLRVDRLPTALYKFNGSTWIEVDKTLSDNYAYDTAYIDHLIEKIDRGEYDPELLSESEKDSIEKRLKS
jgi:hypothetical protein